MIARAHRSPTNPGPDRTLGFIDPASASGRTLQRAERFFRRSLSDAADERETPHARRAGARASGALLRVLPDWSGEGAPLPAVSPAQSWPDSPAGRFLDFVAERLAADTAGPIL